MVLMEVPHSFPQLDISWITCDVHWGMTKTFYT